jgi:hypothetical protein
MKISGIYKIINKINNKYYVGSSKHINPHLQNAWNKYGQNNFDFVITEECSSNKKVLS